MGTSSKAAVISNEGQPRDRHGDDQIERKPKAGKAAGPRASQRVGYPIRRKDQHRDRNADADHCPSTKAFEPHSSHSNRSPQRETGADGGGKGKPQPASREAKSPSSDEVCNKGHGPQLYSRPPNHLKDVHDARKPRSADPEHRTKQDHRRDPMVGARNGSERKQRHAHDRSEHDGDHGGGKPESRHQQRARDQYQHPYAEVAP